MRKITLLFLLLSTFFIAKGQIFTQDFNGLTGTGGNDGSWSGSVAAKALPGDTLNFVFVKGYKGSQCVKLGTSSVQGSAQTHALAGLSGDATLTFKAGAWNGTSEQTDLLLEITGGGTLDKTSVVMLKGQFSVYSVAITGGTATTQVTFKGKQAENARFFLDDVVISAGQSAVPPTFSPNQGNYTTLQTVVISSATTNAKIYYTTDGTTPDNTKTLYTTPVNVSSTTTIKAIAYDATGANPSIVTSATYTFPTNVANIAALRAATTPGFYKLTGEVVLTLKSTTRNAKYIQDATGAVLIDDGSGKITTTYNLGDGITGVTGTIAMYQGMLQLTPVLDPGAATSTGNTVTPLALALADLSTHQAELVKVSGLTISDYSGGTGVLTASKSFNLNGATNPVLRTQYADLNYIGKAIPTTPQDIVGVVLLYNTTTQLVPRSSSEMIATGVNTIKDNAGVYVSAGKIKFDAAAGETVEVYNTVGQKIYNAATVAGMNEIAVNTKGVTIVKVGNRVGKVIL